MCTSNFEFACAFDSSFNLLLFVYHSLGLPIKIITMSQSILNNSKNGYIFMFLLVRYEPFAICLCVGNTRQLLLYMYICTYIHICLPDINVCRPAWILIWFLFACLFVCTYFFLHFKRIYVFSGAQMFIRNAKLCFKLIDCMLMCLLILASRCVNTLRLIIPVWQDCIFFVICLLKSEIIKKCNKICS